MPPFPQGFVARAPPDPLESPDPPPHRNPSRSLLFPPVPLNPVTRSSFWMAKILTGMFPFDFPRNGPFLDPNCPISATAGQIDRNLGL